MSMIGATFFPTRLVGVACFFLVCGYVGGSRGSVSIFLCVSLLQACHMKEVTHHVVVSQKDQFVLDVFDTERDAYANAKRAVIIYEDLREHWRHDARRKHMRVVCAGRRSDRRPSRLRCGTCASSRVDHHDVRELVRLLVCAGVVGEWRIGHPMTVARKRRRRRRTEERGA